MQNFLFLNFLIFIFFLNFLFNFFRTKQERESFFSISYLFFFHLFSFLSLTFKPNAAQKNLLIKFAYVIVLNIKISITMNNILIDKPF